MEQVKRMLEFIEKSPSCYQVVENVQKELETAGYVPLMENRKWELSSGGKYYLTRNGSSLIAFSIPEGKGGTSIPETAGFHMIASHSDSPCFKVKEEPEIRVEEQYVKLNVEKYGGMILSTWLDRPVPCRAGGGRGWRGHCYKECCCGQRFVCNSQCSDPYEPGYE